MGRRLGQLAGILAVALVIARLRRLLQTGPELVQWDLILVASVFLGGVIWWLLSQLNLGLRLRLGVFVAAGLILLVRISVPLTLIGGILPSPETAGALVDEMINTLRVIRSGVPPILPTEGVVAVLAIVMWAIGALYAWGLTGGPVLSLTLPALAAYLQFAVLDRIGAGLGWMAASGAILALAVTSVALDRRADTGRARDTDGRSMPRRSIATSLGTAGTAVLVAVLAANAASGLVSEYGNMPWRTGGSGYGGEGGRVAFERFIDLRQKLISRTNAVLFQATFGEGAPPPETIYWRLETFDEFDGTTWRRSSGSIRRYEPNQEVGAQFLRYQGTMVPALHKVRIAALAEARVPIAGVTNEIHQIADARAIDPRAFQITADASVIYPPTLREGDIYQISAAYPDYRADLGLLATGGDGNLSPMFAGAAAEGDFDVSPDTRETEIEVPPNLDFYTRLPDDMPPSLRGIAVLKTYGASTDFERAFMLERWFRNSTDFTYSTDVSTGHDALLLDEWLTEPSSQNYRTGYCEQFATSMAVLGRLLGIPSRVVLGFTPGEVTSGGVVQVRDTNAHAWVEMWMPEVGWVQFDPTPRGEFQPANIASVFDPEGFVEEPGFPDRLDQPIPELAVPGDSIEITDPPPAADGTVLPRWWPLVFPALALAGLLIPAVKRLRRARRLRKARRGDITAVWDEIVDRLVDLGQPVPASSTPVELARATDEALLSLAVNYSAAIYGGRVGRGSEADLIRVERWLNENYEPGERLRASLSTRSLLGR